MRILCHARHTTLMTNCVHTQHALTKICFQRLPYRHNSSMLYEFHTDEDHSTTLRSHNRLPTAAPWEEEIPHNDRREKREKRLGRVFFDSMAQIVQKPPSQRDPTTTTRDIHLAYRQHQQHKGIQKPFMGRIDGALLSAVSIQSSVAARRPIGVPQLSMEELRNLWQLLDQLLGDVESSIAQPCDLSDVLARIEGRVANDISKILHALGGVSSSALKAQNLSNGSSITSENLVDVVSRLFLGKMKHIQTNEERELLYSSACELLERVVNMIKVLELDDIHTDYLVTMVHSLCQKLPTSVYSLPYFLLYAECMVDLLVFNYHIVPIRHIEWQHQLFQWIISSFLHLHNYVGGTTAEAGMSISAIDEVKRLLLVMSSRGCPPAKDLCDNVMINGYSSKWSKMRFFTMLCDKFGDRTMLSPIGYGDLLQSCLAEQDFESVATIQADMTERQVPSDDANILLAFLNDHIQQGDLKAAEEFVEAQEAQGNDHLGILQFHLMNGYLCGVPDQRHRAAAYFNRAILPKLREIRSMGLVRPVDKQYFVQTYNHWEVVFRCLRFMMDYHQNVRISCDGNSADEDHDRDTVGLLYHMLSTLRYDVQDVPDVLLNWMLEGRGQRSRRNSRTRLAGKRARPDR